MNKLLQTLRTQLDSDLSATNVDSDKREAIIDKFWEDTDKLDLTDDELLQRDADVVAATYCF